MREEAVFVKNADLMITVATQPRVEEVAKRGREFLGRRARQLRHASGLTQAQVADLAGIGRVTLARIENWDQSPRFETLVSLAQALARPVQDLMIDPTETDAKSTLPKRALRGGVERAARSAKRSRPADRRQGVHDSPRRSKRQNTTELKGLKAMASERDPGDRDRRQCLAGSPQRRLP